MFDFESAKTKSLKASRRAVDTQLNGKLSFTKRHRLSSRLEQIDRDLYLSQQQDDKRQLEAEVKNRKQADNRLKDISRDPNHIDPKSRFGRPGNHATGYTDEDYVNQVIDGVEFSNHAIKEMRERGFYSFEILEIVRTTTPKTDKKHNDRWNYYYKERQVFIVTDKGSGRIITIFFDKKILDW